MYKVGVAEYPADDDTVCKELVDAEEHAIMLSYNDTVVAVWDIDSDEIVMLVYQQRAYTT